MTVEARRLGMRWGVYLACACAVPFSIVLPFFLYRREIALDRLGAGGGALSARRS